ncbi:GNAT family N-acetyltransferase [Pigmentiphaga litoralis]|uniref:GNAT family N-acetyltransferase n=1 Tax=Pigmentiphaga litoralis TaxID=516702 RepID=UPI003B42D2FA
MNDPVVSEFWNEAGSLEDHEGYLARLAADPHTNAFIICFDEKPAGYFEAYWAKEDRIGAHYDADDFDQGWHVLIGDFRYRGRAFASAWMPSVSHFLFLSDCRTQRLVIEPRIDNTKMHRNLAQCGYADIKEIVFSHKRSRLGMLLRERFFDEALLIPKSNTPNIRKT